MAKKKVSRIWPTIDVLASACAAQRVNQKYVKFPDQLRDDQITRYDKTNRELVYIFLEDQSNITDVDRELAETIKNFYKGYTFKLLSGAYLSDFDRNIIKILEEEFTTEGYNVALLASVPSSYIKAKQRDDADRRIRQGLGGYVGTIDERLNLQIEVVKCIFSQKWGIYYITGITSSEQVVYFGYKQEVTIGTVLNIVGNVKRQQNDSTQLNRVKII